MNSNPPGGPPGQGGRSEVQIGLSLATIYDLALARQHLKSIKVQATSQLFLSGQEFRSLEFVMFVIDTLCDQVAMLERDRSARKVKRPKRTERKSTEEVRVGQDTRDTDDQPRRGDQE